MNTKTLRYGLSTGERRLAAVMFTDIVGYTALTQSNEPRAMEVLETHNRLLRPFFPKFHGKEIKSIGDSFLVEFDSALDAVRCAAEIQSYLHECNVSSKDEWKLKLRIGIHLGDVIHQRGDVFGDAVNIASRIESIAEPEGICISEQVYDQVQNKFELQLASIGLKQLKNVSAPLEVYKIVMPWDKESASRGQLNARRVAIMPFANISPDPNDEYFADGITEELISTMSRIEQFEVISRTSVMQFKKNPKPIKDVSRELNAGTVLEGSVRKSGNKLRITVQMIDAERDRHVWVESYDRELKDVFSIQSEISKAIAAELKVRIIPSERAKLEKVPTVNTEAYALYLKGRYFWNERTKEGFRKAVQYFTEATRIDPKFARAYTGIADCYFIQEMWGYMSPREASAKYKAYATKALELDDSLPEAHATFASILLTKEWDVERAEQEFKRAIELNPNSVTGHHFYGHILLGAQGEYDKAIAELREAESLDPLAPMIGINVGDQLLSAGRYGDALKQYERVLENAPNFPYTHSRIGLALLKESRYGEAISEIQKAIEGSKDPMYIRSIVPDLILAYSLAGQKADAERLLAELEAMSAKEYVSNVVLAMANGAAGMEGNALEFLQKAAAEKLNILRQNLVEPHFDKMRSDPGFQTILTAVGIKKREAPETKAS